MPNLNFYLGVTPSMPDGKTTLTSTLSEVHGHELNKFYIVNQFVKSVKPPCKSASDED